MKDRMAGVAPVAIDNDSKRPPMPPQPVLETERLLLAPLVPADASEVQELASAFEISDMTLSIPHPYPEGTALRWINSIQGSWGGGHAGSWSIRRRDDDTLVGVINLELDFANSSGELGYWIGVPFWGRGYMTETLRAVFGAAFDTLGLNRIAAHHFVRNPASGRVMEKAGMRCEGTMRQVIRKHDHLEDVTLWAILREDFEAGRRS